MKSVHHVSPCTTRRPLLPADLVEKHGLSDLLLELKTDDPDDNIFVGLNDHEYYVCHTITLQWCASTMHRVRTTQFYVVDSVPCDKILGNPFIQENRVVHPQRVALPLRRKHRSRGMPVLQMYYCTAKMGWLLGSAKGRRGTETPRLCFGCSSGVPAGP